MTDQILIAGASARAAAQSAARAGLRPVAVDLFGDTDLLAIAETRRSTAYPDDLPRLCRELPPGPWMYTGALENYPEIVAEISEIRPLIGNPPEIAARVRDPFCLVSLLESGGIPAARCVRPEVAPVDAAEWLQKPLASGGGLGIEQAVPGSALPRHCFLQEQISGIPVSAVFCAAEAGCVFVGASMQLVGMASQPVAPFQFCGAAANYPLPGECLAAMREAGTFLAREAGLRGLFGIDFVLGTGGPVVVEVNPRYTATVELFERCGADSSGSGYSLNFANTECGPSLEFVGSAGRGDRMAAKVILYSRNASTVPDLSSVLSPERFPVIADIPARGTRVEPGQPVCTVMADAKDVETLRKTLCRRIEGIAALFPGAGFDAAALAEDLRRLLGTECA